MSVIKRRARQIASIVGTAIVDLKPNATLRPSPTTRGERRRRHRPQRDLDAAPRRSSSTGRTQSRRAPDPAPKAGGGERPRRGSVRQRRHDSARTVTSRRSAGFRPTSPSLRCPSRARSFCTNRSGSSSSCLGRRRMFSLDLDDLRRFGRDATPPPRHLASRGRRRIGTHVERRVGLRGLRPPGPRCTAPSTDCALTQESS